MTFVLVSRIIGEPRKAYEERAIEMHAILAACAPPGSPVATRKTALGTGYYCCGVLFGYVADGRLDASATRMITQDILEEAFNE